MKFIETVKKMLPGCAIALVIAVAAKLLEQLEESAGLHLIGASVIALFIGMIVNRFCKPSPVTAPGIKFTSKKILKFAIILLGASLNISTVLKVGKIPMVLEDDKLALQAALKTLTQIDKNHIRMVYIKNTLSLETIMVSEALLDQVRDRDDMEILEEPRDLRFDENGTLLDFA